MQQNRIGFLRFAVLLCGSRAQAEDVVQEVLIRVYLRWNELSTPDGNDVAYVRRAVTNEVISWRRRWSTRHLTSVDPMRLVEFSPAELSRDGRDDELWQSLLAELSARADGLEWNLSGATVRAAAGERRTSPRRCSRFHLRRCSRNRAGTGLVM